MLGWPILGSKMANIRADWPVLASVSHEISTLPCNDQLHPLVEPHVSHFSHVPLRTIVKFWHSRHMLPV